VCGELVALGEISRGALVVCLGRFRTLLDETAPPGSSVFAAATAENNKHIVKASSAIRRRCSVVVSITQFPPLTIVKIWRDAESAPSTNGLVIALLV